MVIKYIESRDNYTTLLDHVLRALAKGSTNTSEVLNSCGLLSARFSYSFAKQTAENMGLLGTVHIL